MFALRIQHGDLCRDLPLPLTMEAIGKLTMPETHNVRVEALGPGRGPVRRETARR
jgi:hypothetical protein